PPRRPAARTAGELIAASVHCAPPDRGCSVLALGESMARVTVEDCLERIPNQFDLTLVAAKRARQLARGADAHLPWGNHKSTVLSLREIAEGHIDRGVLDEVDLPAVQQPKMELEALDPSFDA